MFSDKIREIAINRARKEAENYTQRERGKDKPLSLEFLLLTIGQSIGGALFEAGYSFDELTLEERRDIALTALVETDYPHAKDFDPTHRLGDELRQIREIHNLSLRAVESATGISNAYISQLESGKIKKPSPRYLYKLSEVYNISYEILMEKAGYMMPSHQEKTKEHSFLLNIEDLTEEEEKELLNYLAYLRSKHKRKGER